MLERARKTGEPRAEPRGEEPKPGGEEPKTESGGE